MMRPLQAYSPSPGGIGNSTTNQSNTSNGRPMVKTNSPQLAGRGPRLPRLAESPAPTVSSALRRDSSTEHAGFIAPKRTEDIETPVKAFLSSNITPRSSSRKARVDSASSTPTGTPDGTPRNSRPNSTIDGFGMGREGTNGLAGPVTRGGRTSRPQSLVSDGGSSSLSFTPASTDGYGYVRNTISPESSPMFLHASEANAKIPSKASTQRTASPARTQSFQYANGEYENETSGSQSSLSPPVGEQRPKIFHANAAPESESSSFRFPHNKASSRPQLETIPSAQSIGSRQRSPSPLKDEFARPQTQQRPSSPLKDHVIPRKSSLSRASPRRHTRLISSGAAGELRSPVVAAFGQGDLSRRSSMSTPGQSRTGIPAAASGSLSRRSSLSTPSQRKLSHARSSSANTIGASPGRRSITYSEISPLGYKRSPSAELEKAPSTKLQDSPTSGRTQIPKSTTPPQPKSSSPISSPLPPSQPQSPTRPLEPPRGKSRLEHLNELAASARRERKVLDLEISNSSLLAINQTLEREMRKQVLELRRFRRKSGRSGFSSRRTTLGEDEDDDNFSDDQSSAFDDDDASDPGSTDSTSLHSTSFSPSLRISSLPIPTRFKESLKPFLDLSRQRTLLIDSQKLNLSLKRCLGRTEEMLADAKKALAYRVRVDDLEPLGGRVLTPGDEGDVEWGERGRGLLSPSVDRVAHENPWDVGVGESEGRDAVQGQESEDERHAEEGEESEGLGLETPSPVEEAGGTGLGRYLGSLGESLGL